MLKPATENLMITLELQINIEYAQEKSRTIRKVDLNKLEEAVRGIPLENTVDDLSQKLNEAFQVSAATTNKRHSAPWFVKELYQLHKHLKSYYRNI